MPLADPFGPAPPFGAGTRVVALGSLGGATAIAWMRIYGGYPKPMPIFAGPPFSEDHLVYTTVPFQDQGLEQLDAGDGDGDGEIMMYLLGDTLLRFDGSSVMSMPLRSAQAIAWTGEVFEIATMDSDQSGTFVGEVAVTRDLATVCQSPVFSAPAQQDPSEFWFEPDAIVSAGAGRVLFGAFYVANGVGHQALRQVCL
jgi:hypothetical protein